MVCIIKKPCFRSPGVMVFSQNEYLFGGLATKKNRDLLNFKSEWSFGLHINGNCSFLKEWPDLNTIDFIMWPNINEPFLKNVKHKIIPQTCVYFYPDPILLKNKIFDICITSHAAEHKNFDYAIELTKNILIKRPQTSIVFLSPDPRKFNKFNFFKKKSLYFDKLKKFYTPQEMNQISFVSSSEESFGVFPLASNFYWAILSLSKTSLLTSLIEGTPRCVVESILHQTMPCIMKNLKSGLNEAFSSYKFVRLDNNSDEDKIIDYLNGPASFFHEIERENFFFKKNWPEFINYLNRIKGENTFHLSDTWINHNLNNRLPGHLKTKNFQLMSAREMEEFLKNIFSNKYEKNELY